MAVSIARDHCNRTFDINHVVILRIKVNSIHSTKDHAPQTINSKQLFNKAKLSFAMPVNVLVLEIQGKITNQILKTVY